MTSMGMKRGDMYAEAPKPTSDKDYKNEVVYPCLHASNKQAEMLGAESLDDGEYVKQTVIWRVKKTTIERDGKKDYTLDLDLVKASDPEEVDPKDVGAEDQAEEDAEGPDDDDDDVSPGLAFILAGKGQ